MITNDQQLQVAQASIENLQRVLLAARMAIRMRDSDTPGYVRAAVPPQSC
jgi:hypothetical protein